MLDVGLNKKYWFRHFLSSMSYWQLLSLPYIPTWLDSGTTSSLINIGEWGLLLRRRRCSARYFEIQTPLRTLRPRRRCSKNFTNTSSRFLGLWHDGTIDHRVLIHGVTGMKVFLRRMTLFCMLYPIISTVYYIYIYDCQYFFILSSDET